MRWQSQFNLSFFPYRKSPGISVCLFSNNVVMYTLICSSLKITPPDGRDVCMACTMVVNMSNTVNKNKITKFVADSQKSWKWYKISKSTCQCSFFTLHSSTGNSTETRTQRTTLAHRRRTYQWSTTPFSALSGMSAKARSTFWNKLITRKNWKQPIHLRVSLLALRTYIEESVTKRESHKWMGWTGSKKSYGPADVNRLWQV